MLNEKEIKTLEHFYKFNINSKLTIANTQEFKDEVLYAINQAVNYFNKPLQERILEELGVKVNEEFMLREKFRYLISKFRINEKLIVETQNQIDDSWYSSVQITLEPILNGTLNICKLPPKPLLTEDEKAFLKNFTFDSLKNGVGRAIMFYILANGGNTVGYALGLNALKLSFKNLEIDREYTKEELGL